MKGETELRTKLVLAGYKKVKTSDNTWEVVRRVQELCQPEYKTMITEEGSNYYLYIKSRV